MTAQIINGDSRDPAVWPAFTQPIDCICTDPPYGMGHVSNSAKTAAGKRWVNKIAGDENLDDAIPTFLDATAPLVEQTADDAHMYVFTRWNIVGPWIEVVNELKPFTVVNVLIWDKGTPGMGDLECNYGFWYEVIIFATKGRRPIRNRGRSTIFTVDRTPHQHMYHPTQKPVRLIEMLLEQSTNPGDLVVDPFAGSGSTIIAANRLGRNAIGVELDTEHGYVERGRAQLDQGVFLL